jgi:hypothetical protein
MPALKAEFGNWRATVRGWREELARSCDCCGGHSGNPWTQMRRSRAGVEMAGRWYCRPECMTVELGEFLRRREAGARRETASAHRIPLGLLLLSRQQLTAEQLRTALAAQRELGRGKIGEWLQQLGYVSESQIVAALARQWSCPVLRGALVPWEALRAAPVPRLLLESFRMIPAAFSGGTRTLLMAFSEGVDYTVLYAIGQMLDCRAEACVVSRAALRLALEEVAQRQESSDVVFDGMEDAGECARIVGSYATKVQARKVRMAGCGSHLWLRLERPRREALNLVFRTPVRDPVRDPVIGGLRSAENDVSVIPRPHLSQPQIV